MKLVFVSKECPPSPRSYGIGTYVWETAHGLVRRGHTVTIIAASDDSAESDTTTSEGVRVIRLPDTERPRQLIARTLVADRRAAFAYSSAVARRVELLAKQGTAELVEFPGFRGEAFAWLRGPRPIPTVSRVHGFTGWIDRTWRDRVSATRRLQKAWEANELTTADFVTVVAAHLMPRVLERVGSDRAAVLYNGIRTKPWMVRACAPDPEVTTADIVFVGSLTRNKGIEVLLDAGQLLRARHRWRGRMFLAGRGSREFDAAVRTRWGGADRVPPWIRRLGHCSKDRLPTLYAHAGVCCFPSFRDTFPYTCIEAMASGGIIVGTEGTGMAEALTSGCGHLVPPGKAELLAATLAKVLEMDDRERTAMRRCAQGTVAGKFEIDVVAAEAEVLYARIVDRFRNRVPR